MKTRRTVNRSATERLKRLVEAALARRGASHAGTAREGRLPGSVFQSLLRLGKRPSINRAEALCAACGVSMSIGVETAGGGGHRRWPPRTTATDRLRDMISEELLRRNITAEEAARDARLPSGAFRSVLRERNRPAIDRAEELLACLGLSMVIGVTPPSAGGEPDNGTKGE